MSEEAAVPSPKKAKKLPFKPTALRKAGLPKATCGDGHQNHQGGGDDDGDGDGLAIFRRSKEMEPIVAADRERRMRRRQRQDEERRRLSVSLDKRPLDDGDDDEAQAPRIRSSSREASQSRDHADRDVFAAAAASTTGRNSFSELVTLPASKRSRTDSTQYKQPPILCIDEAVSVAVETPSRLLRSASKFAALTKSPQAIASPSRSAHIISLDSDDDDVAMPTPSKRREKQPAEEVDDEPPALPPDDDDDEFGEYIRRAEEQRARDRAMMHGGGTPVRGTVEIFVTSTVPETAACRVKFLFDKPLRLVRDTWVALQRRNGVKLSVRQDDDVILTWRRNRIYASSTLLSLGICPQGDGRILVDGGGGHRDARRGGSCSGLVRDRAGILMEAWTPELFQQMRHDEERRRRRDAGELSDGEEAGEAAAEGEAGEEPPAEVKIRVILKARGMDVKLTVRPETTVETLITGFRAQRGIGSDRDVGLWFEGDRLAEHVSMDEAEVDDMDIFEVHIK